MFDKWNKHRSRNRDLAMVAVRKCITLKWKESKPPVIVNWWNECSSYLTLDRIYYRSKGRSSDFLKIWQSHIEFVVLLSVSVVFRGYMFGYYLGSLIVVYKIYNKKKKKKEICLMFFQHPHKMTLRVNSG